MYWLLSDQSLHLIPLLVILSAVSISGWLIASHAFSLHPRERILTGVALGLVLLTFFSNLLARSLEPSLTFGVAGFLVVVISVGTWWVDRGRALDIQDLKIWPLVLPLLFSISIITLMGRGIAIFDDRKNLSIISMMAAGDIPPHFYMNPEYLFNYHYGFQLFGALLMRVGGFFPWSAFDLAKGIMASLAIVLAGIWGWRVTHSRLWGMAVAAGVTFGSGGRWLLNFLPQSTLRKMSAQIDLWGAAGSTVTSLYEGLISYWTIDGGPPLPLPFSYVNGVLQPFILKLHKGPISLSLLILFLVLLLLEKRRNVAGTVVLGILFATWALAAEAEMILFGLGFVLLVLIKIARSGIDYFIKNHDYRQTTIALLGGGMISVFQGGTVTETAKGLLGLRDGTGLGGGTGVGGFELRLPPAIVSAHLGELQLTSPLQLLAGLLELGPALLAGIFVLVCLARWIQRGRMAESILGMSSLVGFILPLFLRYDVDRDITRMSAYALMGWIILALPALAVWLRKYRSDWWKIGFGGWFGALIFGGLVVTTSLLSAMPRAVFSYHLAPVDVHMTRLIWDRLPAGAVIFDSHEWRAVPVTGRATRSSADNTTILPEWQELVDDPSPRLIAAAGYDFVYMDERQWEKLDDQMKDSYAVECVVLTAEAIDNEGQFFRRIYDIRACKP
ncbi:MAG: hypothetical protein P1P76_02245 [Anaerolineales bacterium]|nr:hypothetical protein [Anaerolineales bacterium]